MITLDDKLKAFNANVVMIKQVSPITGMTLETYIGSDEPEQTLDATVKSILPNHFAKHSVYPVGETFLVLNENVTTDLYENYPEDFEAELPCDVPRNLISVMIPTIPNSPEFLYLVSLPEGKEPKEVLERYFLDKGENGFTLHSLKVEDLGLFDSTLPITRVVGKFTREEYYRTPQFKYHSPYIKDTDKDFNTNKNKLRALVKNPLDGFDIWLEFINDTNYGYFSELLESLVLGFKVKYGMVPNVGFELVLNSSNSIMAMGGLKGRTVSYYLGESYYRVTGLMSKIEPTNDYGVYVHGKSDDDALSNVIMALSKVGINIPTSLPEHLAIEKRKSASLHVHKIITASDKETIYHLPDGVKVFNTLKTSISTDFKKRD